jgi:hypothetical protein
VARKAAAPRGPSEHQIQSEFFRWAALREAKVPELGLLYAVPNAAKRGPALASKMKREGLKAGVPDIVLPSLQPVVSGQMVFYGSLYIEMKLPTTYPSPHQRDWADRLERSGMKVVRRCTSWQDAARHCLEYLGVAVTPRAFPELF